MDGRAALREAPPSARGRSSGPARSVIADLAGAYRRLLDDHSPAAAAKAKIALVSNQPGDLLLLKSIVAAAQWVHAQTLSAQRAALLAALPSERADVIRQLANTVGSRLNSRATGVASSTSARTRRSSPAPSPHYAAAKAALLALTKSLSKATAGTGIRVNAVSPVFVKTAPIEQMLAGIAAAEGIDAAEAERLLIQRQRPGIIAGRAGRPEEVAGIIAVLCSELASFADGTNVRVDSGAVASL